MTAREVGLNEGCESALGVQQVVDTCLLPPPLLWTRNRGTGLHKNVKSWAQHALCEVPSCGTAAGMPGLE